MKNQADAIFTGQVKSVEKISGGSYKVVLKVINSWKTTDISEYTIFTGGGCSVWFEEGKKYLVYAKKDEKEQLVTEICFGTRNISFAQKDIKLLKKPVFANSN